MRKRGGASELQLGAEVPAVLIETNSSSGSNVYVSLGLPVARRLDRRRRHT